MPAPRGAAKTSGSDVGYSAVFGYVVLEVLVCQGGVSLSAV